MQSKINSYYNLEVRNPADGVVNPSVNVLRFLGAGVTVSQVGNQTQVNVPGGGAVSGTANCVPFFNSAAVFTTSLQFRFQGNNIFLGPTAFIIPTGANQRDNIILGADVTPGNIPANTTRNLFIGFDITGPSNISTSNLVNASLFLGNGSLQSPGIFSGVIIAGSNINYIAPSKNGAFNSAPFIVGRDVTLNRGASTLPDELFILGSLVNIVNNTSNVLSGHVMGFDIDANNNNLRDIYSYGRGLSFNNLTSLIRACVVGFFNDNTSYTDSMIYQIGTGSTPLNRRTSLGIYSDTGLVELHSRGDRPVIQNSGASISAPNLERTYIELDYAANQVVDISIIPQTRPGHRLTIACVGAGDITLNTTATKRVPGGSIVLQTGDVAEFILSQTLNQWLCTSYTDNT